MLRMHYLAIVAVGLSFLTGCGGGLPSVTGVVTMDGQPLDGAVVVFNPDGSGQVATAVTNSSGRFRMGTVKPEDGVRPGKYRVTVTLTAEPIKPTPYFGDVMAKKYAGKSVEEAKDASKEGKKMIAEEIAANKKRRPTPPIYQDPAKTPLVAEVPAENYDFKLKSDTK